MFRFLSILSGLVCALSLQAQSLDTLWVRTYLNDGYDGAFRVFTVDDSILLVGVRSFANSTLPMLMWIDKEGNFIDTTVICDVPGEGVSCGVSHAFLTPQQTLVVTGGIEDDSLHSFVAEWTFSGDVVWQTIIEHPTSYNHMLWQGCRIANGNYAFVGQINVPTNPASEYRFWVVWVDTSGVVYRQQVVDWNGSNEPHLGRAITATSDGGIVIAAETFSNPADLIKLDADGNVVWRRWMTTEPAQGHSIYSIIETSNGDLAFTGALGSDRDLFVIRCDAQGNLRWSRKMNLPLWQQGMQIIESAEHCLVVAGDRYREGLDHDALVASFDSVGHIREFDLYDSPYGAYVKGLYQLADSTFIVFGRGFSLEEGGGFHVYHPGFYAAHLSQDRREPSLPSPFHLVLPADSSLISGSTVHFVWQTADDPDPFDDVMYRLRIWNDAGGLYEENWMDTTKDLPRGVLDALGTGILFWNVLAISGYPPIPEASLDTFCLFTSTDADNSFTLHPSSFSLSAFPNPFNPVTMLSFSLPREQAVRLTVFDVTGREVETLVNEIMSAGEHQITFDGARLPSGIYFAHIVTEQGFVKTQKLMLLK